MQTIRLVGDGGIARIDVRRGQSHGKCQPPKNSATQTALVVIIPAYSARKNRANRIELYSV